jgi:hypothetical protein
MAMMKSLQLLDVIHLDFTATQNARVFYLKVKGFRSQIVTA